MKRAGLLELRSNQARLIFLCVLLHVGEPVDLWPDTGVRSVPPPFNSTSLRKTLDWTLSRVGMSVESFGWLHIDCSKLNFVGFEQHATAVSWCNRLIRWAVSLYTLEQGRWIPIRALQQFNFSVRFWKKKYQLCLNNGQLIIFVSTPVCVFYWKPASTAGICLLISSKLIDLPCAQCCL